MTTATHMNELVETFEKEFALVSCLSGTMIRGVWFVEGGASHHM